MTRRRFLLFAFGWFPFFWRRRFTLGGIRFERIRHGASPITYVQIHGDERTAREVLREHMKTAAGTAWLVDGKDRYVKIKGAKADPNRLFSREGAEKNLRLLNPGIPAWKLTHALDYLDRERGELIAALFPPAGQLLFALHNNGPGYSVLDEAPISDSVALNDPANPHDFFLCTQPKDFDRLARLPYNVVLQNRALQDDDGSLSRLAARRGARYVNLETGLGKAARERELLAALCAGPD